MTKEQLKRRDDIHTCHDQCERIACVQRREIDELKRKLEVAKKALEKIKNHDGDRHSEDPDDTAYLALKEIE